jgi:phage-related tail fiber protein
VTAGTYNNVATQVSPFVVDTYGRITGIGSAVTITPAWTSITSKPTTISGYAITDAYTKTEVNTALSLKINSSLLGVASGVATLDASGLVPSSQLPSYVDDVLEYAALASFPATGETGKIYVAIGTSKIYRWTGSVYIEISPVIGNSDTATKLSTARTISITGDATWSVSFDGSANSTGALTLAASGVTAGTYNNVATQVRPFTVDDKGRVTSIGTAVTITPAWSSITSKPTTLAGYGITDASASAHTHTIDDLTDVTVTSVASGNFLRHNGSAWVNTALVAADIPSIDASKITSGTLTVGTSGNAATATILATSRTISITGDATWSVSFNGSANATGAITLAASGVAAGTYNNVATQVRPFTVDAKGRVTSIGTAVTITPDWSSITSKPTTLAGYGITDALSVSSNASIPLAQGDISSSTLTTSNTAWQIVASVSSSTYRSVKFLVQVTSGASYHTTEILVIHDGTTAYATEFGTVYTGASLATFDADVSGGLLRLLVKPTYAVTTVFRTVFTSIDI